MKIEENILSYLTVGCVPYNNYPELTIGKYTIEDYYKVLDEYISSFSGNIAITLSGGKDSRLLAELCHKAGHNTTTITFGYNSNSIENRIAEKVSKKLNMKHLLLPIKPEMYTIKNFTDLVNSSKYQSPWMIPALLYYFHRDALSSYDAVLDGYAVTITAREQRFYRPKNTLELISTILYFDEVIKPKYRDMINEEHVTRFKNMTPDEFIFFHTYDMFVEPYNIIKKNWFNMCIPFYDSKPARDVQFSIPEKDIVKNIFRKFNLPTASIQMTQSPFPLWFPWYINYGWGYLNGFMSRIEGLRSKLLVKQGLWLEHRTKYIDTIRRLCKDIHLIDLLKEDIFDQQVFMEKMNNVNSREDYALIMERLIYYYFWKNNYTSLNQ